MISKLKSLKDHQGFMRYFKNTSWLFFERIFKMLLGFFVIILLTRYLGPEKFGLFSYAQSYIGIFVAFTSLGIDSIVVRELTKNKIEDNKLIGTAFFLKLIISIVSIFLIFLLNSFYEDKQAVLLTNIMAFLLLFQSINVVDTFFQANIISKFTVIVKTVTFIFSSFLKLVLIYFGADLVYFAYALVFDSVIVSLGYLYIYVLQKKSIFNWKFDKVIAFYFLKNGWPLIFVTIAAFIYTKTDQIMIKHLVGNEAVGNYAAAIRVSELFYFIPLLVTQSIFPKMVESRLKSEAEYFRLLERLFLILIWITIPIALGLFIFREQIIFILFGNQYLNAAGILGILAFSIVLYTVGVISSKILYVEHYEKKYLYRSILGIFVNIVLNFLFISIYGTKGAAIATLITLFIVYYIYDLLDKDLHKFYYLKWKCYLPINIFNTNKK